MSSTGTYLADPKLAEITDEAFERVGVDPSSIGLRHIKSARRSMMYVLSEWANLNIHRWGVVETVIPCVVDQASYTLSLGQLDVLEAVHRRNDIDTELVRIGADEYLQSIPDKTSSGRPDRYAVERTIPTISIKLWPVPDSASDSIVVRTFRQVQDVGAASNTLDMPLAFQEAFVAGLAARLSMKFAPDRFATAQIYYRGQQGSAGTRPGGVLGEAIIADRDRSGLAIKIGRR